MDFSESPSVKSIRGILRKFMEAEVFPVEQRLRDEGFVALLPLLREKRRRAKETGLWAAFVPERFGGAGLPLTEFAHVSESWARAPSATTSSTARLPTCGTIGTRSSTTRSGRSSSRCTGTPARGRIRSPRR